MDSDGASSSNTMPTDPKPYEDEKEAVIRIYGRNDASVARMNGWTNNYPTGFPGFANSQRMRSFKTDAFDRTGDWEKRVDKKLRTFIDGIVPLSSVAEAANQRDDSDLRNLVTPVFVTVVAKKQIQTYINKGTHKGLVYGRVVVADDSGYCIIKLINLAIEVIYNQIEIGDKLLIGSAKFQNPEKYDFFPPLGDLEKQLHVALKVSEYDAYSIYKLDQDRKNALVPKYIADGRMIWSPTLINFEQNRLNVFQENDELRSDVIGVVSHMSRLERFRHWTHTIEFEDGSVADNFFDFYVLCWIEIVDKNSKVPIPVKLYISSSNIWDTQMDLVPGSVILVTNVKSHQNHREFPHLASTFFSQIYINQTITQYLSIMGKKAEFVKEALKIIGTDESMEVFRNANITWSIGGSYSRPIYSDENVVRLYYKQKQQLQLEDDSPAKQKQSIDWLLIPEIPLYRRESQMLVFKATLLRYKLFQKDWDCDFDMWDWANEDEMPKIKLNSFPKRTIQAIYDPIPVSTKDTSIWSMFTRRLPAIDFQQMPLPQSAYQSSRKTRVYEYVSSSYHKYADFLRMPAGYPNDVKKLPVIDGAPHYAVDIYNLESNDDGLQRHIFTWKPNRHLSIKQMEEKLDKLEYKQVFVVAQIHRTESINLDESYGHEFLLHDIIPFVTEEEYMENFADIGVPVPAAAAALQGNGKIHMERG